MRILQTIRFKRYFLDIFGYFLPVYQFFAQNKSIIDGGKKINKHVFSVVYTIFKNKFTPTLFTRWFKFFFAALRDSDWSD